MKFEIALILYTFIIHICVITILIYADFESKSELSNPQIAATNISLQCQKNQCLQLVE